MTCNKCGSKSYPVKHYRPKKIKTLEGIKHITVQLSKCYECGKFDTIKHDLAPKGSRHGWDIINTIVLLVNAEGTTKATYRFMRETGIKMSTSTAHDLYERYKK